jgi:UDP-2,3-diacylglucosamine hydrolase
MPTTMTATEPGGQGTGRVAVIAGSGLLPVEIVRSLRESGETPFVLTVTGDADPSTPEFVACGAEPIAVEEFGHLVRRLRTAGAGRVVMAGGVARRPVFSRIRPTWDLLRAAPRMLAAIGKGDDALLRAVISTIERAGMRVVGAQDIVPDLLAPPGVLTRAMPQAADIRDRDAALAAARAIGALDIGQAAIAVGGRAVALEGVEGTDGLLERMVGLRSHGRLAGRRGGVLVKCAKPGQEMRADLPTIGPDTITAAHAAGLSGVAVEAERSFILAARETIDRANALGLFLEGIVVGDSDG